ncbi:carboxypeptidase-like regulatory domain-containing protein [Catalinimonas alkaloidigena]|uniref:carboxypeptidase-like regulatory domain-containing protein n=1 Tax=Catalinimonas alkaloidigena TaxID=1075417 RepID=UPI001C40B275|nr:carboxypeptidase-like regulatory domain-containing protein [Catalinimonas alkaloidigena]
MEGTVRWENEPMPGCTIKVLGTSIETTSDVEGNYRAVVASEEKEFEVEIAYPGNLSAITRITQIDASEENVSLGTLPVFMNQMIDSVAYQQLNDAQQTDFRPMYHWDQLLGYVSKSRVDTVKVDLTCPFRDDKLLPYKYDSAKNAFVLDYRDIIDCR